MVLVASLVTLGLSAPAQGQVPNRAKRSGSQQNDRREPLPKWQWDLSLGTTRRTPRLKGRSMLPSPPPFERLPAGISRKTQRISSWMFGAGPTLFDAVDPGQALSAGRISPLDGVLTSLTGGQSGNVVGAHLTRI